MSFVVPYVNLNMCVIVMQLIMVTSILMCILVAITAILVAIECNIILYSHNFYSKTLLTKPETLLTKFIPHVPATTRGLNGSLLDLINKELMQLFIICNLRKCK